MTYQLEKKLTSSSIAGACWLFSWAVRHCQWETQDDFKNDRSDATEGLRRLIRRISRRIAKCNIQASPEHSSVRFPSDGFEFAANSLAQSGVLLDIYRYSKAMREDSGDTTGQWVGSPAEIAELVSLAENLLALAERGGAEDAKLNWLDALLEQYPDDRFLLFTESLQTCEALQGALGTRCRLLVGSMSKADRIQAVADLRNPRMNARVLVATSAADEGFDLQVASKVVHWDLSSSPAVLMQRNGRVARLGQVRDVIAYYLILSGTHEERRDRALQANFAEMGIDDEALKLRILGSLSEEQERLLVEAIEANEEGAVGDILRQAASDNKAMDSELARIRTTIEYTQVLSREDLAERLAAWKSMGLPEAAGTRIRFGFEVVSWDRPIFEDVSRMEATESQVALIENNDIKQRLVFDPEFLVFGPRSSGTNYNLAGIPPWINQETRHGERRIVPYKPDDLIGTLLHSLARLDRADFLTISRSLISECKDVKPEVKWLLFCTHPLREAESLSHSHGLPFLTYFMFPRLTDSQPPVPLFEYGADGSSVHRFIRCVEACAARGELSNSTQSRDIEESRFAAKRLGEWVGSVTRFGRSSIFENEQYFVPIPVALVAIAD